MIDTFIPEHHIQKHIVDVLMRQKYARFRDMRLPEWESNLYNYHLKFLQKRSFIEKTQSGYTLAKAGLLYVDRISTQTLSFRIQPKILSMLVIQNGSGEVLLYKRGRQPYADVWTLPYGKLHIEDVSIHAAAQREVAEKLAIHDIQLRHVGDCYIRVYDQGDVITSTLAHVFHGSANNIPLADTILWAKAEGLPRLTLGPAVEQIVSRTLRSKSHFFEEYNVEWQE